MVFKSNKKVKSEHPKQSRNWGQTKSHKAKNWCVICSNRCPLIDGTKKVISFECVDYLICVLLRMFLS